jgi:hypothetical protein
VVFVTNICEVRVEDLPVSHDPEITFPGGKNASALVRDAFARPADDFATGIRLLRGVPLTGFRGGLWAW